MSLEPGVDLSQIPLQKAPPGYPEGIGNGTDLAPILTIVDGILLPITVILVALRTFASLRSQGAQGGLGIAEYSSIGATAIIITHAALGLSFRDCMRHSWNLSVAQVATPSFTKRNFAFSLLPLFGMILGKISLLLVYLRLFEIKRYIRLGVTAGIVWTLLTYCPLIVITSYFCAPHVGQSWNPMTGSIHCGHHTYFVGVVLSSAMTLALDIYLLILPIPVVIGLHLSAKKKFGIFLIFFTAVLACVCVALSLRFRTQLLRTNDSIFVGSQIFIVNVIEYYIAIIVGAIPGATRYFKKLVANSVLFAQMTGSFISSVTSFTRSGRHSSDRNGVSATSGIESMKLQRIGSETASQQGLTNSGPSSLKEGRIHVRQDYYVA